MLETLKQCFVLVLSNLISSIIQLWWYFSDKNVSLQTPPSLSWFQMQHFFISLQTGRNTLSMSLSLFIVRGLMIPPSCEGSGMQRNFIHYVILRGHQQGPSVRLIRFMQQTVENTGVRPKEERGATVSTSPSQVGLLFSSNYFILCLFWMCNYLSFLTHSGTQLNSVFSDQPNSKLISLCNQISLFKVTIYFFQSGKIRQMTC